MKKSFLKALSQIAMVAIGVVIGVLLSPRIEHSVAAQQTTAAVPQPAGPAQSAGGPKIVTLQSYSTSGAMGSNVLLAHNLQADIAVVNGYDIMKINQQILNYLANLPVGDRAALNAIVKNSKAEVIYRLPNQQER